MNFFQKAPTVNSINYIKLTEKGAECEVKSNTDKFYETAWNEVENGDTNKASWAKAFSISQGDAEKAKALYIQVRVRELSSKHVAVES